MVAKLSRLAVAVHRELTVEMVSTGWVEAGSVSEPELSRVASEDISFSYMRGSPSGTGFNQVVSASLMKKKESGLVLSGGVYVVSERAGKILRDSDLSISDLDGLPGMVYGQSSIAFQGMGNLVHARDVSAFNIRIVQESNIRDAVESFSAMVMSGKASRWFSSISDASYLQQWVLAGGNSWDPDNPNPHIVRLVVVAYLISGRFENGAALMNSYVARAGYREDDSPDRISYFNSEMADEYPEYHLLLDV